ncbi:MAG: MurR/RpiR family transcriptional regulator [Rubrobacteraceae bacterium]
MDEAICILCSMGALTSSGIPFGDDFEKRVSEAHGLLSKNDRRIVDHVRDNPGELAFHTSESLAQSAGVSQAAAVRFARRLGYRGFAELRSLALEDLQNGVQSPADRFRTDGRKPSGHRFAWDIENLLKTASFVEDELPKAAAAISQAATVYVLGDRESYGLASFLHRRLHTILANVRLIEPSFADDITCVRDSDVVVACLFRRYSRLTVALVEKAREAGARIVLVTDGENHDSASAQDQVLVAATESPRFQWSMVAPLAVIESLVVEVAAVDPRVTYQRLEATDRFKREHDIFL